MGAHKNSRSLKSAAMIIDCNTFNNGKCSAQPQFSGNYQSILRDTWNDNTVDT